MRGSQRGPGALSVDLRDLPPAFVLCTLGISLHLPLRLIFRQMHPNLINVRSTYAS